MPFCNFLLFRNTLGKALEDLAKHLWETGTTSDPQILVNCITYAGTTLRATGENEDIDLAPETESAYNTTMLSLEKAKRARNDILGAREHQQNVDGIEAGTTHPITEEEMETMKAIGSQDAEAEQIPLAPTPNQDYASRFTGPNVTMTSLAAITTTGDFKLLAHVSQANSMNNFKLVIKYPNFLDVAQGAWYYDSVKQATEYGFVSGGDGNKYNPDGPVTIQEAIMMAARIRCIYEWGSNSVMMPIYTPVGNADSWAVAEINYAIQNGIIGATDFTDYTKPVTRAEMAHIFANVLPESTGRYAGTNVVDTNAIPDVPMSTQYSADIYKLYKAGILTGTGSDRLFQPNDNIDRASTAAIASRIPLDAGRQQFTLLNPNTVHYAKLADGTTQAPWPSQTVYVGTANNSTAQPRKTTATGAATTRIDTRYGFHNYWCANQKEYDACVSFIQNVYNSTVKKGTVALDGVFFGSSSWKIVDDIIAGRPYDSAVWKNYITKSFPAIANNISGDKAQAETLKLYGQYRLLLTSTSMATGETGGITAYDALYLGKGSCNSSTQIQMLCADMLGIDSCSFVSKDHQASILRINGVYFSGESQWVYNSYEEAITWADFGQMTEWTSSSAPTK